tara:strand:+ start:292 stop:537 length:246 start_codon:yes stop_codon:yes gene_type:complete
MADFIPTYRRLVTDEIDEIAGQVCAGQCSDYAAYKEACGRILGLQNSLEFIKEAVQNEEDQDDIDTTTPERVQNLNRTHEA